MSTQGNNINDNFAVDTDYTVEFAGSNDCYKIMKASVAYSNTLKISRNMSNIQYTYSSDANRVFYLEASYAGYIPRRYSYRTCCPCYLYDS